MGKHGGAPACAIKPIYLSPLTCVSVLSNYDTVCILLYSFEVFGVNFSCSDVAGSVFPQLSTPLHTPSTVKAMKSQGRLETRTNWLICRVITVKQDTSKYLHLYASCFSPCQEVSCVIIIHKASDEDFQWGLLFSSGAIRLIQSTL